MLSHAAQKIAELHEAGYVHRDLKPGKILFRKVASAWFLIGFDHVAKSGKMAPLAMSTVKYAAPETILAEECSVRDVPVHPAVDAWALGVIAFEVLVGKRAFAAHSDSKVCPPCPLCPQPHSGQVSIKYCGASVMHVHTGVAILSPQILLHDCRCVRMHDCSEMPRATPARFSTFRNLM